MIESIKTELQSKYSCIKGFPITYTVDNGRINVCVSTTDGVDLFTKKYWYNKDAESVAESLKETLYTEEELLSSPITDITEYNLKSNYLRLMIRQVKGYEYPRGDGGYYRRKSNMIYDPVSSVYVPCEYKSFVEHHIWLYSELQKALPPTIFKEFEYNTSCGERFVSRYKMLPYADKDDPMLPSVMNYLRNNVREFVLNVYPEHDRDITRQLIMEDFVKKPTMKKLLDKANEVNDTETVAILLEKMKNDTASKSRFDL